ncbi:phosphoadenosine phosphosulfate reductase family protein [Ensifer aridi]|uniref:phosphoadenosine phosphosulfate reductase domain-containing protein n=1 Tax=Ensifer aridi TaxID=1708715 RepID=UPI001FCD78B1|nr:phosphoadenosine phosphosulfate reductase family protein [Ensifer aridi]
MALCRVIEPDPIRFVIFSSYGNDSCALIQWAHENDLKGVAVVYTDTKWAASGWSERVLKMELWCRRLGFMTFRCTSIGFKDLARQKQGFPTQRYQWCSYVLKILPGQQWLAENDPERSAICLVGVRREESQDRANFPEYLINSANHGGRMMVAPFATWTEADRNGLLRRAGIEPLPHRSRECKCINSNREDLKRFTLADVSEIAAMEREIGKNMYRPARHMGARGVAEVIRWAHSERGKYVPRVPVQRLLDEAMDDTGPDENMLGCDTGFCPS